MYLIKIEKEETVEKNSLRLGVGPNSCSLCRVKGETVFVVLELATLSNSEYEFPSLRDCMYMVESKI